MGCVYWTSAFKRVRPKSKYNELHSKKSDALAFYELRKVRAPLPPCGTRGFEYQECFKQPCPWKYGETLSLQELLVNLTIGLQLNCDPQSPPPPKSPRSGRHSQRGATVRTGGVCRGDGCHLPDVPAGIRPGRHAHESLQIHLDTCCRLLALASRRRDRQFRQSAIRPNAS